MSKRNKYFREVGEYFGYPECCINSFIEFVEGKVNRDTNQLEIGNNGLGFIPCSKHAKELVDGSITFNELFVTRKSECPYPIDDTAKDILYVNSLKQ